MRRSSVLSLPSQLVFPEKRIVGFLDSFEIPNSLDCGGKTVSIMTFFVMTLNILKLDIDSKFNDTQHKDMIFDATTLTLALKT